jgi:hypothetical protein
MAPRKKKRTTRAKPLMQRFAKEPVKVTKAEWRKLPPWAKVAVALTAVGFTGIGANEIAQSGRVGKAVAPLIDWGAKLRAKLA